MGGGTTWPERLTLREARLEDLEALVDIMQAGYPDDPGCGYKFPYREQYPDDYRTWTGRELQKYLEMSDKFAVMVMVTPEDRPVALGVWDVAVLIDGPEPPGIGTRRDANVSHAKAYTAALVRGVKKHFFKYLGRQYHLWLLVTHPDFRRRGAGSRLCNWAQEQAPRDWALTVMGSPMGRALYEYLGYKLVGTVTARVEDEEECVVIYALEKVLQPERGGTQFNCTH